MIAYNTLKADLLKSDKILVVRMVERDGRTFPEHYWVARQELEPDDLVLHDPGKSKYFCCKDEDDFNKLFEKTYSNWFKTASPDEIQAIQQYTGNLFSAINSHLRWISGHTVTDDGTMVSGMFDKIAALDSAIDNFELTEDIVVHRMVEVSWLRDLRKHTVCNYYHDPSFLSTTVIRDPTAFDAQSSSVHCIIKVPKGKGRGIWAKPLSYYPEENEFLLRRDVAYAVEGIHRSSSGHWVVKLKMSGLLDHVDPKGGSTMKKSENPEKMDQNRIDRFTFKSGDGKFYATKEDFEEQCKKEGRTVIWLGDDD